MLCLNGMQENRKFKRISVKNIEGNLNLDAQDKKIPVDIKDITPEGFGFESPIKVNSDSLKLRFNIDGKALECKVCLQWMKSEDKDYLRKFIGGFKITQISEEDRTVLLMYYLKKILSLLPQTLLRKP